MLTVDGSIRLMTSGWVDEIHIPESYLDFPDIIHIIQEYHWRFFASESPGWVCLRRHVGYHD